MEELKELKASLSLKSRIACADVAIAAVLKRYGVEFASEFGGEMWLQSSDPEERDVIEIPSESENG